NGHRPFKEPTPAPRSVTCSPTISSIFECSLTASTSSRTIKPATVRILEASLFLYLVGTPGPCFQPLHGAITTTTKPQDVDATEPLKHRLTRRLGQPQPGGLQHQIVPPNNQRRTRVLKPLLHI